MIVLGLDMLELQRLRQAAEFGKVEIGRERVPRFDEVGLHAAHVTELLDTLPKVDRPPNLADLPIRVEPFLPRGFMLLRRRGKVAAIWNGRALLVL